jgi:4-hydroxybenzoate polyprenyltransferase/phosphoserine phosphatase
VNTNKLKGLALDLDGTLLATDSLWELFFKALSEGHLSALFWLLAGRLTFKAKMAKLTELNFDLLPWNQEVIKLARAHKAQGGEVWLATAANEVMAKKVVNYFDFFSGYLASDKRANLKGQAKAKALADRFGLGGFIYAGDSRADLSVWPAASGAIVVGSEKLAQQAKPMAGPSAEPAELAEPGLGEVTRLEPVGSKTPTLAMIAELAEPLKCLNCALVFLPMFLTLAFSWGSFFRTVGAFLGFGAILAAGRTLLSLFRVEEDRRDPNPQKRQGLFAAGRLDLSRGGFIFLGFLVAGSLITLSAGSYIWRYAVVVAVGNIFYVYGLKKYLALRFIAYIFVNMAIMVAGFTVIHSYMWLTLPGLFFYWLMTITCLDILNSLYKQSDNTSIYLIGSIKTAKDEARYFLFTVLVISVLALLICLAIIIFPMALPISLTTILTIGMPFGIKFTFARPWLALALLPCVMVFFARLYRLASRLSGPDSLLEAASQDLGFWLSLAALAAVFLLAGPLS